MRRDDPCESSGTGRKQPERLVARHDWDEQISELEIASWDLDDVTGQNRYRAGELKFVGLVFTEVLD